MKIKRFILIALCFIFLFSHTVSAEDTKWKEYLKDFLTNNFPSLFDEATIKKNEEIIKRWHEDDNYIPEPSDIPVDWIGEWIQRQGLNFPVIYPYSYKFYDLDYDNIPEIIINYTGWELSPTFIYKMNGNKYEQIHFNNFESNNIDGNKNPRFQFYLNANNKIVVFITGYTNLYSVNYVEITNGELTLTDYIDSIGNDNYYGLKYNNLFIPETANTIIEGDWDIGIYQTERGNGTYRIWASDFSMNNIIKTDNLTPLPEFDCSDVLNSIKYGAPLSSPKTGDNYLILFILFILLSASYFVLMKLKRSKNV